MLRKVVLFPIWGRTMIWEGHKPDRSLRIVSGLSEPSRKITAEMIIQQ